MSNGSFLLPPSWMALLSAELDEPYMKSLFDFIVDERSNLKNVYPAQEKIFNAFNLTSIESLKVVILGQDPYHGKGQAHGLSFSVEKGVKVPPSLGNIYKELNRDLSCIIPSSGDLTPWAEQGVLLLNSVLTVEQGLAASHRNKGWEKFTDQVINQINQHCENIVFMLWGAYAQKKGKSINQNRHLVLKAMHPSPLAAHRGFFGCRHFSQANKYLLNEGLSQINWQIDDAQINMLI